MTTKPVARESNDAAAVACDVSAFTKEELQRLVAEAKDLFGSVREARPLPDGWEMEFTDSPDLLQRLASFVALDRVCCPHIRHAIVVEARRGPISLQLGGPEGTKEALAAEISDLLPEHVALAAGLRASEYPAWIRQLDALTQSELNVPLPQLHGQLQMAGIKPFDAFSAGVTPAAFFEQHMRRLRIAGRE